MLRDARERFTEAAGIPVVEVIQPAVRAAVRQTRNGRIGVIGTAGTIASGAYDYAVRRLVPDARVYAQPCPLFVPFVEEGWTDHAATRLVVEHYMRPLKEVDIDVLILGCTHYPLLTPLLHDVLGDSVKLVDSGHETALEVQRVLRERELLRNIYQTPEHEFIASDSPMRFREIGRRFLGGKILDVQRVDVEGFNASPEAAAQRRQRP